MVCVLENKENWLFEIKLKTDYESYENFTFAYGECNKDGKVEQICYVQCFIDNFDKTFWVKTTTNYGMIDVAECEQISEADYIANYDIFEAINCNTSQDNVRDIYYGAVYFEGSPKIDSGDMTRDAKNMAVNRVH